MNDTYTKNNPTLNLLKFIASLMVIVFHTIPLSNIELIDIYYGQWLFRFCIPLFFISSGFYIAQMSHQKQLKYLLRTGVLYAFMTSIYYIGCKDAYIEEGLFKSLFFGFYHLWYLAALFFAVLLWYLFKRFCPGVFNKIYKIITIICLVIGAIFDNVYLSFNSEALCDIHDFLFTKNVPLYFLFFAFPMLMIGKYIYEKREYLEKIKTGNYVYALIFSFILSFIECTILYHFIGKDLCLNVTFFNYLPAIFIFILSFRYTFKNYSLKTLRTLSIYNYLIHPLIIFELNGFDLSQPWRTIFSIILSVICSYIVMKFLNFCNGKNVKVR